MPSGIGVSQGIISDIAIAVQVLWIGIPWHNRIRTDKVVNIRRIPPLQPLTEKAG